MPVREAWACRTPTLISDIPELREAGGPSAYRVEPTLPALQAGLLACLQAPMPKDRITPPDLAACSWQAGAVKLLSGF